MHYLNISFEQCYSLDKCILYSIQCDLSFKQKAIKANVACMLIEPVQIATNDNDDYD